MTVAVVPDRREIRQDLYRTAATDASGNFHLQDLPPGNYKVFAWETVENGAWFDPEFMKLYDSRGITIRINEGGNESLTLSVLEGN